MTTQAKQAAQIIQQLCPNFSPKIAIMLGSGLADFADALQHRTVIDYQQLPGFPQRNIEGHQAQLVLGKMEGVAVMCLQGRPHCYEGNIAAFIKTMVRSCYLVGCKIWLATNAAGSLQQDIAIGSLAMVSDHINMQFSNPLVGENDAAFGPRFLGAENLYSKELRGVLRQTATEQGIKLGEGVYLATLGPSFETPAEIKAFRLLGASLVGMSTLPEVIVANHCGMRVACVSVITNLAAGMHPVPLSHAETLAGAAQGKDDLTILLRHFIKKVNA